MRTMLALTIFTLFAAPIQAADVQSAMKDIGGPWQLEFTTPDGTSRTPYVIIGRQFDELLAWYADNDNRTKATKTQLNDDSLVLTFNVNTEYGKVKVTFDARLSGNGKCEGKAEYQLEDGDSGDFDFTGKRIDVSTLEDVSTWNLSLTTPDGETHSPKVTVVSNGGKYHAWLSGRDHEVPANSVEVNGEKVAVSVTLTTQEGDDIDATFRGTVNGESVQGDLEFNYQGQTGSVPFTGKRAS